MTASTCANSFSKAQLRRSRQASIPVTLTSSAAGFAALPPVNGKPVVLRDLARKDIDRQSTTIWQRRERLLHSLSLMLPRLPFAASASAGRVWLACAQGCVKPTKTRLRCKSLAQTHNHEVNTDQFIHKIHSLAWVIAAIAWIIARQLRIGDHLGQATGFVRSRQ